MGIPDPYAYFDFREWLRDALANYSYSQVIPKLGLKSKGHITQILQGKRNVPPHLAQKLADLFEYEGQRREFLLALIEFTQAKSHVDKKIHLDQMVAMQAKQGALIAPKHYDICKHWYYPVIRELIRITPFKDNFEELGKLVDPPITAKAAETAIHDLEKMGLIRRNKKGKYQQTEAMLTFGEAWQSVVVREFQHQAMDLQKQALDRFSAEQREIANSTLCMSEKRAQLVKQRMNAFRHEILSLVLADPDDSERVFQLNFGFFPLSATRKSRK